MADPINQINEFAAHTVSTYGSVGGSSYVTGHAAAMDAKAILDVLERMIYVDIYECDGCGIYYDAFDLAEDQSTRCCGTGTFLLRAISKRMKR